MMRSRPFIRRLGWPVFPYTTMVRVSLWISVAVVALLFAWGAWQRRWIADDGLIVLRTVRNLLAGNGPVFNQGERVEANTSTAWTYLMYLGSWVGGPMRMEYVALALALTLSVVGVALLMLGTARLYAPSLRGRRAVMLPAGALVYVALPPSRDFATSGLESGLALAYLGLLWWMMVCWAQPVRNRPDRRLFIAALAFVAGFSVLVRPELALMGGLALIMMLVAARTWRRRVLVVVAGGLLPVACEIFRMGYYGLLVPGTALAKDAAGDKWSQGMIYLSNFDAPYAVWVPVVLLVPLGVLLLAARRRPSFLRPTLAPDYGRVARAVQSPPAVVAFVLVSGLLQALYWIRQGGDFMHGRVLLAPLFCLLAPVAVIPVAIPDGQDYSRETGYWVAGAAGALWLGVAGWSVWAANSPGMGDDATHVTYSGIVDERRFYAQATGHAHPLTAADYLGYPRMAAILTALDNTPDGALLLPVRQLHPVGPGADGPAAAGKHRQVTPKTAAHSVFHQPWHGGHERRARCQGDRPDRIGESACATHGTVATRPYRARQEPFPGLGDRRRPVGEGVSGYSGLFGRAVGRGGGRRPAMPRDQGGAELGARTDDPAPIPLQPAAFL